MTDRKFDLSGPIIIVGAGPAGLGAARMLQESGFGDWTLYERTDRVGGLAGSFVDERGFTWDLGGHVVFSHYDRFTSLLDDLLGPTGWIEHERESWIRLMGRWVPYPFQNNLHRLPERERAECLAGLMKAAANRRAEPFADFDDFIVRTFGGAIADLFMRPYNWKAWGYRTPELGAEWIGDRVSVPDPERVARNVELERDDVGWGPNNKFRFPVSGGTGVIWNALAAGLPGDKVITGREVTAVDPGSRTVELSDGARRRYGALISTMPLNELARLCGHGGWIEATSGLRHSSVHVVGVGLKGRPPDELKSKCWIYFPEDDSPFYRVTHFSLYSHNNVPDITRRWSLMCEVSESPGKPVDASRVVDDCVDGLVRAGLIEGPGMITHTWSRRAEYAYPTPTKSRDEIILSVLPEMYEAGILSRGRFGGWRYEVGNMDHSFMQGYEAAGHILSGASEVTIWNPDAVNR